MRFEHSITIPADPATVWALTVDVESWPELTPTITSVELLDGPLAAGARARIVQPRQRPRIWTVSRWEPLTCFEWGASMGPIRMVGRHEIEAVAGGARNLLTLELSGPGSGLLGRLARRQFAETLATENAGFLRAAEAVSPSHVDDGAGGTVAG